MNPLVSRIIESLVRAAMVAMAGHLVRAGIFDQGLAADILSPQIVTAVALSVVSVLWSVRSIITNKVKLLVALQLHPGATEADVEHIVNTAVKLPDASTPKDTPPTSPVLPIAVVLLLLLIPAPASAQVVKGWDWFSWGTAAASVAVDTVATFHCPDRLRCVGDQATRELGTFAAITFLKNHIHSERPCAPECGFDNAFENMPSAHAGFGGAFSQGRCSQKRLAVEVPLGVLTAVGRVKARKHTILATVVGAGVGAGVSALSSAMWCR